MGALYDGFLIWPALSLAFFIGYRVALCWTKRATSSEKGSVSEKYYRGLNFLLNEQPDKAIEVFIQALEVDSETVELHLALGGLFRRKGEIDRATRIHQNLIARPNLTDEQRLHAIFELAQDYDKAGLLDRAENLYRELLESNSYRSQAIEGLCGIYQKEKEWQQAIEVMRLYRRNERPQFSHRVSHFWCELAQEAIELEQFEEAKKYLKSAVSENRKSVRAVLLKGRVCFQEGDYQKAIQLWQSIAVTNPSLSELFVVEMISCFQKLDDRIGLEKYLTDLNSIPKDNESFNVWQSALINVLGENRAIEQFYTYICDRNLTHSASDYLLSVLEHKKLSSEQQKELLKNMLNREKLNDIEYTCLTCGFDTKAMHWHCPNCGEWDSFS